MTTVVLIRHARSTANAAGILAGRMDGVALDDTGVEQSRRLADFLAGLPLEFIVRSELQRTEETIAPLLALKPITVHVDTRLTECDYGDWSGRSLKELSAEPLWSTIQKCPSEVSFPGGESMLSMRDRAVAAVREWSGTSQECFAVVSHGDVIKAIVAEAMGLDFDRFQSLHVAPASVSILHFEVSGSTVSLLNGQPALLDPAKLVPMAQHRVGGGDSNA